jgi:hypothetical protein
MQTLRDTLAGATATGRETLVCTGCALEQQATRLSDGRVVFDAHPNARGFECTASGVPEIRSVKQQSQRPPRMERNPARRQS